MKMISPPPATASLIHIIAVSHLAGFVLVMFLIERKMVYLTDENRMSNKVADLGKIIARGVFAGWTILGAAVRPV
jgi:hypothetical protein